MTGSRRVGWRWVATAWLCVAAASCGIDPVDPVESGGELLPGTEAHQYLGGRPFTVSPDGRWLLFAAAEAGSMRSTETAPSDLMLEQLAAYALLDLTRLEARGLSVRADVPELADRVGGALVVWGGCWVPHDGAWLAATMTAFGHYLLADPRHPEPGWTVSDAEPFSLDEHCALVSSEPVVPATHGPFRLVDARGDRVRIVDAAAPDRVLAEHRASRLPGSDVSVSRIGLGPFGARLAYVVRASFGSFSGRSSTWVLADDGADGPIRIASSGDDLRWGPDGTLYVAVREPGYHGIYRWRAP